MKVTKIVGLVATGIVFLGAVANAQVAAPKDGSVIYGHHHINATSTEEHKRFWIATLGGTAVPFGSSEVVKFTNVLVFIREQVPTGGTKGTTVNHIGFTVPDLRAVLDKMQSAGYPVVTAQEVPPGTEVIDGIAHNVAQDVFLGFVMAPDETKVEFISRPTQSELVKLHHIHFATQTVDDMKAWYVNTFGAIPGMRGSYQAADLPGVNLTYTASDEPLVGTKGRSFDHVGFEVDGLKAFCEKLEKQGIVFDVPYREIEGLDLAIAFFTDPFGTYVELTEGLDKL